MLGTLLIADWNGAIARFPASQQHESDLGAPVGVTSRPTTACLLIGGVWIHLMLPALGFTLVSVLLHELRNAEAGTRLLVR